MDVGRDIAAVALGEVGPQGRSPAAQQGQRDQDEQHPDHERRDAAAGPARGAGSDLRPGGTGGLRLERAVGVTWLSLIGTTPSSLV